MTLLEALEQANTEATTTAGETIKTFKFAQLDQFNSFLDSFKNKDYPVNVVVPLGLNSRMMNDRIKDTVRVEGWILTKLNKDTTTYRSQKIEDTHIGPMRNLAKAFLSRLLLSDDIDIIDPEVEEVSFSINPEYGFLDQELFGVSYSMDLPVADNFVC